MHADVLVAVLLEAAICALLAFLAAWLLRMRQSVLGYIGAGLLGQGIGSWLAAALNAGGWPVTVDVGSAHVHLLWTFVGALLVLLVV
jgi:uncharacterized membrane protein YeaQ/YmgE (transglycosylase-associated protein family)